MKSSQAFNTKEKSLKGSKSGTLVSHDKSGKKSSTGTFSCYRNQLLNKITSKTNTKILHEINLRQSKSLPPQEEATLSQVKAQEQGLIVDQIRNQLQDPAGTDREEAVQAQLDGSFAGARMSEGAASVGGYEGTNRTITS